jgi:hypothetical protein
MTFSDQLRKLKACDRSLQWAKGKTIKQAWEKCENSHWMMWLLSQTDLDLTDPICDMAEEVLYLVPEEHKLVCSNAISAARRCANRNELKAAYSAASKAARNIEECSRTSYYRYWAMNSAFNVAYYAAYHSAAHHSAAHSAAVNAAYAAAAAVADYAVNYTTSYRKEEKKQCDILRKHFTLEQVKEALNKIVA